MDIATDLHTLEATVRQARADVFTVPGATVDIVHLLNGAAEEAVRASKTREWRRENGVYFTPTPIADRLVGALVSTSRRAVILDPAAGAGDLLLAAARSPRFDTLTLKAVELQPDLAAVCRARLNLAVSLSPVGTVSAETVVGDALASQASCAEVTHVVMNPPFTTGARAGREWGDGRGSHAADFVWHYAGKADPGVQFAMILPDVLRSGSRYERWRQGIESLLSVRRVEPLGRFSREADVDVFLMTACRSPRDKRATPNQTAWWEKDVPPHHPGTRRVGDAFTVRVGPVVDYRSPHKGVWLPFLRASDLRELAIRHRPLKKRRFTGWTASVPFVAVPRTSRNGESPRAKAVVVSEGGPYAVENHVLIMSPLDGRVESCHVMAEALRTPFSTAWLDARIRCRHLTTASLAELPIPDPAVSN